jgi:hypothetical protein
MYGKTLKEVSVMSKLKMLTTFFVSIVLTVTIINAEENKKSLDLSLNVTQASYSDNWVGGEAGNVSWVLNTNGIFKNKLSDLLTVRNTAKLAFGQTINQDNETKKWSKPVKSTDKIDLESLGLFDIKSSIEPYLAFRLESQFLDASNDTMKLLINPVVLTESAGIARQILKEEKNDIITRLGMAIKENFARTVVDAVAEETESETTIDGGVESITDMTLTFSDKLAYMGKLSLYKALFYSEKDKYAGEPAEDYWKAIDVNWENTITASIAKYVQVSLYLQFLFDKQISVKGRFKETLALGLTYKMF